MKREARTHGSRTDFLNRESRERAVRTLVPQIYSTNHLFSCSAFHSSGEERSEEKEGRTDADRRRRRGRRSKAVDPHPSLLIRRAHVGPKAYNTAQQRIPPRHDVL